MTKPTRHHASDEANDMVLAPKHLTKQQFGKRLYALMLTKGWHQSELARRSGLARDSISVYVRGKSLPTPLSLKALAEALDVSEDELLPNFVESAIDDDNPAFEMKVSPNAPDRAWLRVNQLVSTSTAAQIADMIEKDRLRKQEK